MASGSQTRGQTQGATVNNKQAQLGNAYQELGRELGSELLKVVGGYTLGRVIGEGTFGSVHLATHRLTGARCAIKKIPKSATAHLTRELHHHRRLHHPHIVQLHEIVATESHVWLVTELCSGGELFDYLVERGRLTEGEARRLFGELTVAVGWLHRQGVVHRDLKLENVLLDGELRIKLGDLGFAREWQRGRLMETFCGTTGYASPEMLACRRYLGVETDIWSLGVILYTLLCGGLPFDDDDERVMKDLIQEGKYEEPDWLSQESRSLIHDMLQVDPAQRISIEGILSHPWFKLPITDHSQPPTPNPGAPSSSRRASQNPPSLVVQPNAIDSESSEVMSDFGSQSKMGSGVTTPTTAEEEMEEKPVIARNHSGEFSQTERQLELLHPSTSQSTIRRPEARADGHPLASVDEEAENSFDQLEPPLTLPLHSRTPSRTKRRSVSSQISVERRHSHHSTSVIDYLSQLNESQPDLFSTTSEKHLLKGLTALGFDIGQLMHSVRSDACDCSSATWWILRAKQAERGETDASIEAMNASAARRRERAAAYAKEERRKARERTTTTGDDPADSANSELRPLGVSFAEPTIPKFAISNLDSVKQSGQQLTTSLHPETPPRDSPSRPDLLASPSEGSPKERERIKTRSPSMSMLQRATSALTGKRVEDKPQVEEPEKTSPTKLVKPLPKLRRADVEVPSQSSPSSSVTMSAPSDTNDPQKSKGNKRDSLWTAFRHMFVEDRRRKRNMPISTEHVKIAPAVVLSRGPAARGPHVNRLPQPSSRRGSLDVRPNMQSRRSSSVNSRRSSINSSHLPPELHDSLAALGRKTSHRSQGSQTPTSDREYIDYPSRPGSATSLRRGSSRRSSHSLNLRSPSIHSEHSARAPPSPLHDYQRRHPSGSNSRRVRHFTILPEAKVFRSSSVASSIRSNSSSRRSSFDKGKHDDLATDSDYDTGRDDASFKSFRRRTDQSQSLAHQIHRTRSPLVHGLLKAQHERPKAPSRDVFQQKDDEWVDEDEIPAFEGGLGQTASALQSSSKAQRGAASYPTSAPTSRGKSRPHQHEKTIKGKTKREIHPSVEHHKDRDHDSSRRLGIPERSGKPPIVMEEVEEEEEE